MHRFVMGIISRNVQHSLERLPPAIVHPHLRRRYSTSSTFTTEEEEEEEVGRQGAEEHKDAAPLFTKPDAFKDIIHFSTHKGGNTWNSANLPVVARNTSLKRRKLSSEEIEVASRRLTSRRVQQQIIPFKDPAKIQAWKEGKIAPREFTDSLIFKDTPEGNVDIIYTKDPDFSRFAAELLAPLHHSHEPERRNYLLDVDTNIDTFFSRRSKNIYNFNLLLRAMAVQKKKDQALEAFKQMRSVFGIQPDTHSYVCVMSACANVADYTTANELLVDMSNRGFKPNLYTYGALVNALVRGGKIDEAFDVVEAIRAHQLQPDVVIHCTLLTGCVRAGMLTRAWDHFELMRSIYGIEPDEVTYSVMINAAAEAGEAERAMRLFDELELFELQPSEVTFNTVIKAFAQRPELHKKCFEIADRMEAAGHKADIYTYNTLIHTCAKLGDVKRAYELLAKMRKNKIHPDEITYNIVLHSFSMENLTKIDRQKQNIANSFALFDQMKTDLPGKVGHVTANTMLQVLCNALRKNRALYFMRNEFKKLAIEPDSTTYSIMVHMYTRLRDIKNAKEMFKKMKKNGVKPTYQSYKDVAFCLLKLGKQDEAKEWLKTMHTNDGYMLQPEDVKSFRRRVLGNRYKVVDAKMEESTYKFDDWIQYPDQLTPKDNKEEEKSEQQPSSIMNKFNMKIAPQQRLTLVGAKN